MTLYVKTTSDRLRLPVAVAESTKELAEMLGISAASVRTSYSHGCGTYYKVEVDDEADE
jgi:hypothetical protein